MGALPALPSIPAFRSKAVKMETYDDDLSRFEADGARGFWT